MTTKEILIAARKLIEKPEHWTQFSGARDADGGCVPLESARAVSWCADGAICRASFEYGGLTDDAADVLEVCMEGCIAEFNDSHTHAEVLAAFDRAIAVQP